MFVSIITLASLIATGRCAPGLSLDITGPTDVDGVHNLKITATLKNVGDSTMSVLTDPRTPLSIWATNTFSIVSDSDGSSPDFTGVKVKYVPDEVVKRNNDSSFTVLEPGQSVSVEHDLSLAYNFTRTGEGAYSIEARNKFHYVDPTTNQTVAIEATSTKHKVNSLVGKLAVARQPIKSTDIQRRSHLTKRTKFSGCDDDQVNQVFDAIPVVKKYASQALEYLQDNSGSTQRYTTWFGDLTQSRHDTVTDHYSRLTTNDFSDFVYICTCDQDDVYAFVNPDEFGVINLCGAFWRAPVSGTDSKGGTILHESSHFTKNGGTEDHAYGHTACQALAQNDPDQAVGNADTHEYFAENQPSLS
ncbi:peptidyl-Lys metalloendopeptidase [Marasmius fiardii PR-910]|nr:peptidyl-Lys metalloendopeptidase [Marasmius fiardii PR-910]